jgi:signal transduction histidine kinase
MNTRVTIDRQQWSSRLRHALTQPLASIQSLKTKFSIVIVAAIFMTAVISQVGYRIKLPIYSRSFIAATIALVVVRWLAHGHIGPLREMEHAATQMAAGEHGHRVRTTSQDEVGRLAAAFNQMASELEHTDRLRRDLIANASHELRTPIAGLQATLENLIDGISPPDPAQLQVMHDQVARIGRLVADLLDLSRLEAGVTMLRPEPIAVDDLIAAALAAFPDSRHPRIDVEAGLVACVDVDRLVQVLTNLIDNAYRHGGDDVVITARGHDGALDLTVWDNGEGVPSGSEDRIFERFERSDRDRSVESTGTGLGLTIVKWIVELHGGRVHLDRTHGTSFVIELPGAATVDALAMGIHIADADSAVALRRSPNSHIAPPA